MCFHLFISLKCEFRTKNNYTIIILTIIKIIICGRVIHFTRLIWLLSSFALSMTTRQCLSVVVLWLFSFCSVGRKHYVI